MYVSGDFEKSYFSAFVLMPIGNYFSVSGFYLAKRPISSSYL